MDPVSAGEVVERQQHIPILDQLGDGFGVLVAVDTDKVVDPGLGVGTGFGLVDLVDRSLGSAMKPLGESVENVRGLVDFMPISA